MVIVSLRFVLLCRQQMHVRNIVEYDIITTHQDIYCTLLPADIWFFMYQNPR
jgi:hypothetical protein